MPWAAGLAVAGCVAILSAIGVGVLGVGLLRVHPMLALGLNALAGGGLAPTIWGWRNTAVLRWFTLGTTVGVVAAWLVLLTVSR